jgi:outer membrane biosynthesis protein TonB
MARAHNENDSLRFSRRERERVMVALLLSLLVHLGLWVGYHTGHRLGWWQKWHAPAWLAPLAKKLPRPVKPLAAQTEDPTIYVDVSQADADAPVKPKFYSNNNSHAANPDVANANAPKINGRQTDSPKTEEVPKLAKKAATTAAQPTPEPPPTEKPAPPTPPTPLQPAPAQPEATEVAKTDTEETPSTPGETDLLKPKKNQPPAEKPSPQAAPDRPRTLKQVLAQRNQLPGRQMQQAGGVTRYAVTPTLDAKATPFGAYDSAIIEAVTQRWYDLLDSHHYADDRTGKVTLRFKLMSDGSVIEVKTLDNSVGDLLSYLCQEAIEEAAPFAKWPPDMVRKIDQNYRELTFTFYYY